MSQKLSSFYMFMFFGIKISMKTHKMLHRSGFIYLHNTIVAVNNKKNQFIR